MKIAIEVFSHKVDKESLEGMAPTTLQDWLIFHAEHFVTPISFVQFALCTLWLDTAREGGGLWTG